MKKVIARPGDKVSHGGPATSYTVVSRLEFMGHVQIKKSDNILVVSDNTGIYYEWATNHQTRLNREVVTHYIDNSVPTITTLAGRIPAVNHEPAVPRLENQKPDEDGMVTGWDGRKVWL